MNTLEIGPRFDLNLYKIEEGFLNNQSSIIYHAKLTEVEAMKIKISKFKENKENKKGKIKIVKEDQDNKKVKKDEIELESGMNSHGYKENTIDEFSDGKENSKTFSEENKEIKMLQKKRVQIQQKLKLKTKSKDLKKDRENLKRKREEMQKNR